MPRRPKPPAFVRLKNGSVHVAYGRWRLLCGKKHPGSVACGPPDIVTERTCKTCYRSLFRQDSFVVMLQDALRAARQPPQTAKPAP